MKTSERVAHMRHDRAKPHKELDQMHFGMAPEGLGPAQLEANDSAQRLWIVAIAILLVAAAPVN